MHIGQKGERMTDLIDRQMVIDAIHYEYDDCCNIDESGSAIADDIERIIDNVLSVQPERKKGHWVFVHPLQKNDNGAYICSECKVGNWVIDPKSYFFCPNCGADMRGEKHETD